MSSTFTDINGNTYTANIIGELSRDSLADVGLSTTTIKNAILGNNVSSIGNYAFSGATNFEEITISTSVTKFGTYSFHETGLLEIIIPDSVQAIEQYAFFECVNLTSVEINPVSSLLTTIGNSSFEGTTSLTEFTISSFVTNFGVDVFKDSGLEKVYLMDDLTITYPNRTDRFAIGTSGSFFGAIDVDFIVNEAAVAIAPICFPAGTPVTTDQGNIAIEKLNSHIHTIRGKPIVAITQTRPLQKHIVSIEKDALANNVPSQTTEISLNHKVFYKGQMVKARDLVGVCEHAHFISYNGETLYNVLLEEHDKMMINNLICETLSPKNIMAMISRMNEGTEKNIILRELTCIIKKNDVSGYKKLYASLK